MVSINKRSMYVTESDSSSSEDLEFTARLRKRLRLNNEEIKVSQGFNLTEHKRKKCTNKNAVLARENRRRKKIYLQSLEEQVNKLQSDNQKLNTVVDNQSFLISELKKEVKYLKSVLANSSDIRNLIKNIRSNTGMSVTTSLDKPLALNNCCVSKHKVDIARKTDHPWQDVNNLEDCSNSLSDVSLKYDLDIGNVCSGFDLPFNEEMPFTDFPFDLQNDEIVSNPNQIGSDNLSALQNPLMEHSYTNAALPENDVGVCLHVSKHRVSLEFCPACNENAHETWNELEQQD